MPTVSMSLVSLPPDNLKLSDIFMKKSYSVLLACALLALPVSTAVAAQQFPSYEEAAKRVTDDGYILFIYPEGWDRYGEKLCKKLVANEGVKEAAGSAALILAPIYQNRTEKTNAKAKKVMGSFGYPGDMADISYPALIFYDKTGRQYSALYGESLMDASVKEVAKLVKQRMDARKKQQALLDESGKTTDVAQKARLVFDTTRVHGVEWPNGVKESLKSIDPEDKQGYRAALDFGFGIQANESLDSILKRLDAALENENIVAWKKQRACAMVIGHIRRAYGPMAGGPYITKYAGIMQKLDPESPLGLSAPVVMRDWVKNYHYGQGWSDQIIPSAPIPVLMHDVPITKPGTYNITFKLTTGRDGIKINCLRLMDGDDCVVADSTPREVGWHNRQVTYTFAVKKTLKKPALEITYGNAPDKRSSWGDITISAQ